jgi:hypothetical protein
MTGRINRFPNCWYSFQVSKPSPDQQGCACERHDDSLLFLRFGCIFSLDNIPRSFHLGSLTFCVVARNIMAGTCVQIAHIRSLCFLSSQDSSLSGSPDTRVYVRTRRMVVDSRLAQPCWTKNIVSCMPLLSQCAITE